MLHRQFRILVTLGLSLALISGVVPGLETPAQAGPPPPPARLVQVNSIDVYRSSHNVVGSDVRIGIHDNRNKEVDRYNIYRGERYIGTITPSGSQPYYVFFDRAGVASAETRYKVQAVRFAPGGGREWGPFKRSTHVNPLR